jgi:hypothetical protein
MAKQSAIEQDGSIIEALSNAMFRVELEMDICNRTYLEKCVCIISSYYLVISETRNEPFCQKQELLIDIKGYSNES